MKGEIRGRTEWSAMEGTSIERDLSLSLSLSLSLLENLWLTCLGFSSVNFEFINVFFFL